MEKETIEYLPVNTGKTFFFNLEREFSDWPIHGSVGERVVWKNGVITSREDASYDEIYGWLTSHELYELRQREPRLAP